jgi:8-oxo-dGTP pyrophosphatase MutT (NUDIX family)
MAPGDYHIVLNVWLRNSRGEWLISKRTPNKTFPNMWECTGGSAVAGEDSLTAAMREVKEELGIDLNAADGRLFYTFCHPDRKWPDFVDVWIFDCDVPIDSVVFQEDETCGAMWASNEIIQKMITGGAFIGRDIFPYIDDLPAIEA